MINRNISLASSESHDIVIVGGGIYGACLAFESARLGMKPLLIERDDFGGATSWNSLGIIHGGLRYLQNLDLVRYVDSVTEQAWWLTHFPEIVRPLSCLMPLYNRGLRRAPIMAGALKFNDLVGEQIRRFASGEAGRELLASGRLVNNAEVARIFPSVDARNLCGGAIWTDATMDSPARLLIELLRWACACGATCLNYVECTDVLSRKSRVTGVRAKCRETGAVFDIRSPIVVMAAGPWNQELAKRQSEPASGTQPLALACNLVLDRLPASDHGLALTPPRTDAPTYFMVPCGTNQTMVGTMHLPDNGTVSISQQQIGEFLADINRCVLDLDARQADVTWVKSGRLPAARSGAVYPAKRPIVKFNACGLVGCVMVSGVKYTTARRVAERTLRQLVTRRYWSRGDRNTFPRPAAATIPHSDAAIRKATAQDLRLWMETESVLHIDDLLLRRRETTANSICELAESVMETLVWSDKRRDAERLRLPQPRLHQQLVR